MKLVKFLAIMIMMISFAANVQAHVMQFVPVDNVYAPPGYNSNDNVEVVVSGFLPNLCYRDLEAVPVVEGNKVKIKVQAKDFSGPGIGCADMIVPFVESVKIGLLDQGDYDIVVNNMKEAPLYIDEFSDDAIDDEFVANIESIEKNFENRQIVMKGHNPSDCYVFDRFEVNDNGRDVYSVKPIMKKVRDFCPMKMVPFELNFDVPQGLMSDRILIHVRSMYGQSVNSLFNNDV